MVPSHVCGGWYDVKHVIESVVSESASYWPGHRTSGRTFSQMGFINATPLKIAAALGEVEMARSLIEHGASVDGMVIGDETPLHFAAKSGQEAAVELLIRSGANVNSRDQTLCTPCKRAASWGRLASVQALVEGGADITLQDSVGFTALHCAASQAISQVETDRSEYFDTIVFLIHKMTDSETFATTKILFPCPWLLAGHILHTNLLY